MVKGVKALGTTLGGVAGTGLKIFNASVGAAATGVTALVSASTMAYAEYEQLVGGVETLFGAGGQSLEESLKRYEEGVKLLDSLEKELESAKQRLTVLRQGENGDDVEEPLGGM